VIDAQFADAIANRLGVTEIAVLDLLMRSTIRRRASRSLRRRSHSSKTSVIRTWIIRLL